VGVEWSPHPTAAEVNEELARMWRQLGDRPIEALLDLPPMTDPTWRATVTVLATSMPATVYTDENLTGLVAARIVNLSLEHGNSDGSSLAYTALGRVLGRFDDYARGFRFGSVGFHLMEKRGPLAFKPIVLHSFAHMVNPWGRPFRTSMDILARAQEAAQQIGDVQNGSYVHATTVTLLLAMGEPLRDVELRANEGLAYVRQVRYGAVADVITTQLRLIRALRGLTPRFSAFDGDDFDEQTFEGHLGGDLITAVCYWIRKLQGRFLAGDRAAAVEAAAKAAPLVWAIRSFPEEADYHFFAGLARAAAHDGDPPARRDEHLQALLAHHRQLELWARSCPDNFATRAALIGAELARLRGEPEQAAHLYEKAIRSARDSGLPHNEAIAFETAARFYRGRGFALIADTYLREARDRYLIWGAEGKARDLEARHPQLAEPHAPGPAATVALSTEQLDLLSVVKASQTISGVMVRERLLRTLLHLVLEQSGARRALVVLAHEGRLDVAAEVAAEERPTPSAASLPSSLLAYVQRTHERVLLDDARADAGRFSADPYLAQARPRSVLCLPIRRQAEIVALLYLENDLVPGVFTPERLLALELLAAQAAISLENAHLLEREHLGRQEAEAAERRAVLLGEATEVMTSTPDYEGVFVALTRLCVRTLAEWAVIDVVQGDRVVRLAGAHRLAEKEPLLRELAERYPADGSSPAPATTVLKTGVPLLLPHMTAERLQSFTADARHAELIRQLGTGSAVIVPLVARDTKLGALTLGAASPGAFSPPDVELASELGRRVALAVDNSRLLRETQRAVRLRDEFLSVASHELRTPVTALMLGIERLLRLANDSPQPAPPSAVGTLQRVRHSAERLGRLTDELLDVTRLERGHLELSPAKVDLGGLARQVVDDLRSELANAGCPVQLEADLTVTGLWDPSRLEQVITNLLTNALKFGQGHPIEIHVRDAGAVARLVVRDHGVGIETERQPFVFERFSRAVSPRHYGGLGLGLHIALRIVQAHGGELRVESAPGQGATFTVTLPWVAPAPRGAEALTP
jgi:signal transduction histidine kinase